LSGKCNTGPNTDTPIQLRWCQHRDCRYGVNGFIALCFRKFRDQVPPPTRT